MLRCCLNTLVPSKTFILRSIPSADNICAISFSTTGLIRNRLAKVCQSHGRLIMLILWTIKPPDDEKSRDVLQMTLVIVCTHTHTISSSTTFTSDGRCPNCADQQHKQFLHLKVSRGKNDTQGCLQSNQTVSWFQLKRRERERERWINFDDYHHQIVSAVSSLWQHSTTLSRLCSST